VTRSGIIVGVIALGAVVFGVLWIGKNKASGLTSAARRLWKEQAIKDISARGNNTNWVRNEISRLRANASNQWIDTDAWLSPGLILMTNGDWIAYSNVCRKEKGRIHDLFIGRGSDGKWYYSTYHFCINMITLRIRSETEGAHGSLVEFSNDYSLSEFDGRSDVCLQKTWPPKRD
jgi:hypothetical protein